MFVEDIENDLRCVGYLLGINLSYPVDLGEQCGDANRKLRYIISFGVIGVQVIFEQLLQILILWNVSCRGFDLFDVAVNTKLGLENPDKLITHAVSVISLLVFEEIIDREDRRRIVNAFGEVQIVLNVLAQRDRKEVQV